MNDTPSILIAFKYFPTTEVFTMQETTPSSSVLIGAKSKFSITVVPVEKSCESLTVHWMSGVSDNYPV